MPDFALDAETALASPDLLRSGQTLKRPLCHPVSGQTFLPAGAVLTEHLVSRIRKLGLEAEALACLPPAPAALPRALPPADLIPPNPANALQQALDKGFEQILAPEGGDQPSLVPIMVLVRTMIQRLKRLDLGSYPALRLYGGGDTAHPINVTMFAILIGLAMNRSDQQLFALAQAALLHDIGKHRLDPRLVSKTQQLTSAERRVLERHVEFGVDALLGHRASALGLSPDVLAAIQSHHERWDGTGYPRGLKKQKIPLAARILRVADAYETMTTDRPYRSRRLPGEAYREILALSGEAFDPQVVEAFRRVIVPYPNQTLVQLSSGQIAHVIRQGDSPDHPIVHLGKGEGVLNLGQPGSPRIVKQLFPRLHPRLAIELPARIALTTDETPFPGRIEDLSLGGAKVASYRPLAAGTPLLLALETAEKDMIWLPGVVASCAKASQDSVHLGVRFLPLSPAARQELERVVGAKPPSSR